VRDGVLCVYVCAWARALSALVQGSVTRIPCRTVGQSPPVPDHDQAVVKHTLMLAHLLSAASGRLYMHNSFVE